MKDQDSLACRVGQRIKKIRMAKRLTRNQLGDRVGLSGDRIQQYENGARHPKKALLEQISAALGVSPLALQDPDTTNCLGAMYALFEIAELSHMTLERTGDESPKICLSVDASEELYWHLCEWQKQYSAMCNALSVAASQEEAEGIKKAYHDWQWKYSFQVPDVAAKTMKKQRLMNEIKRLQAEYDAIKD